MNHEIEKLRDFQMRRFLLILRYGYIHMFGNSCYGYIRHFCVDWLVDWFFVVKFSGDVICRLFQHLLRLHSCSDGVHLGFLFIQTRVYITLLYGVSHSVNFENKFLNLKLLLDLLFNTAVDEVFHFDKV